MHSQDLGIFLNGKAHSTEPNQKYPFCYIQVGNETIYQPPFDFNPY